MKNTTKSVKLKDFIISKLSELAILSKNCETLEDKQSIDTSIALLEHIKLICEKRGRY